MASFNLDLFLAAYRKGPRSAAKPRNRHGGPNRTKTGTWTQTRIPSLRRYSRYSSIIHIE